MVRRETQSQESKKRRKRVFQTIGKLATLIEDVACDDTQDDRNEEYEEDGSRLPASKGPRKRARWL